MTTQKIWAQMKSLLFCFLFTSVRVCASRDVNHDPDNRKTRKITQSHKVSGVEKEETDKAKGPMTS